MNAPGPLFGTLFVGVLYLLVWWMPMLTRPEIYFAHTVACDFRTGATGRGILRRYRRRTAVFAGSAAAMFWLHGLAAAVRILTAEGLLLGGMIVSFLTARHQVEQFAVAPTTTREVEMRPQRTPLPGGWPLAIGPFLIIAAAAWNLRRHWSELPARIPVHWDLAGHANAWVNRDSYDLVRLCAVAAAIIAFALLLVYASVRWSRRIHATGAAAEAEDRFRNIILWLGLGVGYMLALTFAGSILLPLYATPERIAAWVIATLGMALALVILVLVLAFHFGQGGSRLTPNGGGGAPVGDRTPDRYWKAGLFYVNRADPAIFVEKRFGIGYTVNFGHPLAWLILLVPILAIVLLRHG